MNITNLLIISFLSFNNPPVSSLNDCSIRVNTQVVSAKAGLRDGSISLTIQDDSSVRYKVFLLNKGSEKAKEEVQGRKIEGLAAGTYEFIIIDTKGDKCFKELSVEVK